MFYHIICCHSFIVLRYVNVLLYHLNGIHELKWTLLNMCVYCSYCVDQCHHIMVTVF